MSKVLAFTREDGGLSILIPSLDYAQKIGMSEDALIQREALRQGITSGEVIDSESLPQDRTFRDAWKLEGSQVKVDMEKAKEVALAKLRLYRDQELEDTDGPMSGARESGDKEKTEALADYRQKLRNLPELASKQFEKAKTPEELKALDPLGDLKKKAPEV